MNDGEQCAQCGFRYDLSGFAAAGPLICDIAAGIGAVLVDGSGDLRARRDGTTWSPLEYACHLRDVLLVQRERVLGTLVMDRPSFPAMGRDERVEHDGYSEQAPGDVARQLVDAALLLANVLARLSGPEWDRTMMYNYPTVQERTLRWVAIHTLHEARHHDGDIRRQLAG